MSTEYNLSQGYVAVEQSAKVSVGLDDPTGENEKLGNQMDHDELCQLIIELVQVASYISSDPEETLKRFNVKYGEKYK